MALRRFEDDRYYRPTDPDMRVLGTPGTLAQWRHRAVGPPYIKHGRRVLYLGKHLNGYLDERVVMPRSTDGGNAREILTDVVGSPNGKETRSW